MPFERSRHVLLFGILASCVCGLALVAQTPKVLLALSGPLPAAAQASPRTAHTLQPPPPAEPMWQTEAVAVELDYPDLVDAELVDNEPTAFEPVEPPAEFGSPADFGSLPVPDQEVVIEEPQGFRDFEGSGAGFEMAGEFDRASEFEPANEFEPASDALISDDFEAVDVRLPAPQLPPAFESEPSVELVVDGELGAPQSEPWPTEPSIAVIPVPQPAFEPVEEPEIREPVLLTGDVAILSFTEPREADRRMPRLPKVVEGSYRLRSVEPEKVQQRMRQTYRFSAPPIESVPKAEPKPPVKQSARPQAVPPSRAPSCPHCRRQIGHRTTATRICPGCGTVHR